MKSGLPKEVLFLFGISMLILFGVGTLIHRSLVQQTETAQWVAHTHQVIEQLEALLLDLTDAETGQRGYLLTQDTSYLAPYHRAVKVTYQDINTLRRLTQDNPRQQHSLNQLEPLFNRRLVILKEGLDLQSGHKPLSAGQRGLLNQGNMTMMKVRYQVNKMISEEHRLLEIREAEAQRATEKTLGLFLIGSICFLVLQALAFLLINREIKQRQEAEQRAIALNHQLEAQVKTVNTINNELEAFSYSVSHDLRAPLRSLDGYSQMLIDDYSEKVLDEIGIGYLERIRLNSQRMGHLIDDILKLSRVTREQLSPKAVDLTALVTDIAHQLQEEDPTWAVEFKIESNLTTHADPHLITVVLENLLQNAWKFSQNKAPAIIEFGKTSYQGKAAYFIKDNGAGFDMNYADKLFGAFQRLHTDAEFPGTGIGLATCQRIIHRHGGEIWAEAAPDQGATFYFTLS